MVDKVYSLAVRGASQGQLYENVLHIRKITAGDPTDAQWLVIANRWKDAAIVGQVPTFTWLDWIATQVTGDGVTYDPLTCRQVGGTQQTGALTGTLVGADVSDPEPLLVAMSVGFGTGLRGRSFRTHVQLGGFAEDCQSAGVFTTGFVTNYEAAVNTFMNFYASGGSDTNFRLCTFSRGIASGCFPDPNLRHHPLVHRQAGDQAASFANITSFVVRSAVTTMRSRKLE